MSAAYIRELTHAKRDAEELAGLLERSGERTMTELMQAIGLASMAHDALLRAIRAIHMEPPAPPNAG